MSFVGSNILAGASGQGGGGYEIERSLRFNSGDSAYLNRTPSAAGNRKTWTWSGWVKRASYVNSAQAIFGAYESSTLRDVLRFTSNSLSLQIGTNSGFIQETSSAVYRDSSAWYHIIVVFDSTQATAADRVKIYVNGLEQALSGTPVSQNTESTINNSQIQLIGARQSGGSPDLYLDGYQADVHFIDGQALAPTDFGETDDNGVWQPKEFAGSYTLPGGTNYSNNNQVTGSTGLTNVDKMFDGQANNVAASATVTSSQDNYILWTPTSSISYSSSVEIFAYCPNGYSITNYYSFNGGTETSFVGGGANFNDMAWQTVASGSGSITSIKLRTTRTEVGAVVASRWAAIRVDGTILTNVNAQGANSFHLPFSDNSSNAALGTDTSGNSNTWTVNNLSAGSGSNPTAKQNFDVLTYTGNGGTQTISGLAFQPDFVWYKNRSASGSHKIFDSIRGATKVIYSNYEGSEGTIAQSLSAFTSSGFTVGNDAGSNTNGNNYVAWCWKAGGAAVSNTDGTITSSVSVNASHGFSIARYTGTGANASFGHGLSTAPKYVIVKDLSNSYGWTVWHAAMTGGEYFVLNTTAGKGSSTSVWNSTVPSNSVITVGTDVGTNKSGDNYVCYSWAESAGFSKFGSWNGNSGSTTVTFGFKPRFVLWKSESATNWHMIDSARGVDQHLYPNEASSEANQDYYGVDFTDTGITINSSYGDVNASGSTYLYMAFAETVPADPDGDSLFDTSTNGTASSGGDPGGAIVGNYATLNPLAGGAPTNGNLHQPNNSAINYATIGVSSGKWYFETTINTQTAGGIKIGVAQAFNTGEIGGSSTGWAILGQSNTDGGKGVHAGALTSSYTTYAQGDIVNCAFDMDSGKIYWGKNGTWLNSGNPDTGAGAIYSNVSGTVFPAATANQGGALSWNFGQRAFNTAAPSGYKSLNTANLPEPTIADGSLYFDTKTYVGTGNTNTQDIGLNLSPDFTWIKARNGAQWHMLMDVIRGGRYSLSTNTSDAENDRGVSNLVFGTDKITVSDGHTNFLNKQYVAWNWDAGSSNTTIAAGGLNSSVYNQSQTWSNGWVSGNFLNNQGPEVLFNGTESNWSATYSSTAVWENTGIPFSTIEIETTGNETTSQLQVNNTFIPATKIYSNSELAALGITSPLTHFQITSSTSSGPGVLPSYGRGIKWIKLDGKLLVDAGVSVTNVPSIASTVRANPSAGFSIVSWSGSGSAATIGHSLNTEPELIIVKPRTGETQYGWRVYSKPTGNTHHVRLDTTASSAAYSDWNSTTPTSSVFSVNGSPAGTVNASGSTYIAYCFAPVEGYSAMGSYEGNGSADGPFIYTGFKVAWLMTKNIDNYGSGYDWHIYDAARNISNVCKQRLNANLPNGEDTYDAVDFLSNGFKIRNLGGSINLNAHTHIYLAFASNPFKTARAR